MMTNKYVKLSLMMDDEFEFKSLANRDQIEILEKLEEYVSSLGLCAHIKVSKELAKRNSKQIGEWVAEIYSKMLSDIKDWDVFSHHFEDGSFICLVKVNGRIEISSFYDENKVDFDKNTEQDFLSGLNFLVEDL